MGESTCLDLGQRGEGSQDPSSDPISVRLRHPQPALVLPFLRLEAERHIHMETRPWVKPISHTGPCTTRNPNAAPLT